LEKNGENSWIRVNSGISRKEEIYSFKEGNQKEFRKSQKKPANNKENLAFYEIRKFSPFYVSRIYPIRGRANSIMLGSIAVFIIENK
jgi:hypothetical protein